MKIFENQQFLCDILISENPTEQEVYAASELTYYLEMMTARPIDTVKEKGEKNVIALGSAANKLFSVSSDRLGADGFIIRTIGENLIIQGNKRGIIYGVYELLEKLGCRFFTITCEKVPTYDVIDIGNVDETQIPKIKFRSHNYYETKKTSGVFAAKQRFNGYYLDIPQKFGGSLKHALLGHTFTILCPPEIYFKDHPEYFSLVDGVRSNIPARTQLCLTNPDVLQIVIENVKKALRENPDCDMISVSQDDGFGYCECENCKKVDDEEESHAGTVIRFVNAVAEAIEDEFPNVTVETFAYVYSRKPPKFTKPRHNVAVRLCSIECCFAHALDECEKHNSSFLNDLEGWGKICDNVGIWDYTTCFANYPAPFPNWRLIPKNIRIFTNANVTNVFEQANGSIKGGVDMNELRSYIISKMLWNPECDIDKHIREFVEFFYGKAATPHILAYINALCDKVEKDNIHVEYNDNTDAEYLTDEMLDVYNSHLDKAIEAVKDDPVRYFRVSKIKLSTRWIKIKNDAMLKGIHDKDEINRFYTDWKAFGLSRIDEWVSPQTTHKALVRDTWRGIDFYRHWADEGSEFY